MRRFMQGFLDFFRLSPGHLRKHAGYALMVLLVQFIIYFLLGMLVREAFEAFWIGAALRRLSERSLFLRPLYALHQALGSPILNLFRPLMLYLAYSVALVLSAALTGTLLGRLARAVEQDQGATEPTPPLTPLWFLRQEALMVCNTLAWGALLFFVGIQDEWGLILSQVLFYVGTPLVYALYNLAFPLLRRGYGYSAILRIGMRHFASFYGFALASASGFYLILFLLARLPEQHGAFALLFALNALFRPLSVAAGARQGLEYLRHQPSRKTTIAARVREGLAVLVAVAFVASALQFAFQANDRLDLIDCRYRLLQAGVNFPRNLDRDSLGTRLLRLYQFADQMEASLELEVANPLPRPVSLETMLLEVRFSGKRIAGIRLKGFRLAPEERRRFDLRARLQGVRWAGRFLRNLLQARPHSFRIRALVFLDLWFGRLAYPLWLVR